MMAHPQPALATAALLILAGCATPYSESVGTPLESVAGNYLTLWAGVPVLFGMTGSAVVVGDGVALTNRHVVTAFDRVAGYSAKRGWVGVTVTSVSDRMDLAVLALPTGWGSPVDTASAYEGQRVWLMGTPAIPPSVSRGEVVRVHAWACVETPPREKDDLCPQGRYTPGVLIKGRATAGFSGGPVVDEDGRLVAIVQGVFTRLINEAGAPIEDDDPSGYVFAYPVGMAVQELARLTAGEPAGQTASSEFH